MPTASLRQRAFTLLEVLVALLIIGIALAASLRAIASLTRNSHDLRVAMMATWSAENRLTQIRLAHEWPELGRTDFACPQGELALQCEQRVLPTPNPSFRRVELSVSDLSAPGYSLLTLSQVVPNVP